MNAQAATFTPINATALSDAYHAGQARARMYRGCILSRITAYNMAGMRWEAYCNGRFIKAETLTDLRASIREEMQA